MASHPSCIALVSKLRRLCEANGITREAAGYAIRRSSAKISRLELGRVGFKERDVADLLALCGATDERERNSFLTLARQANAPGWWRECIRTYEPQLVPGLLQTEDCARAIIRLRHLRASDDDVERRVALRMARQGFLTQPGAPAADVPCSLDIGAST